jgi:hypothetical protein
MLYRKYRKIVTLESIAQSMMLYRKYRNIVTLESIRSIHDALQKIQKNCDP